MSRKVDRKLDVLNHGIVNCDRCPRLRAWCSQVAREKRAAYQNQAYWGQPLPNFGPASARVVIVGLAPGAHGANRTGRMFTGDSSGDWLFRALHRAGFAKLPTSTSASDGQQLIDCIITNACHCAPPGNKPTPAEVSACEPWLDELLALLPARVIMALGKLAWDQVWNWHVRTTPGASDSPRPRRPTFSHGAVVSLTPSLTLIGSYHPSRQNTNTGRLTERMLDDVFKSVRELLHEAQPGGRSLFSGRPST